MTSFATDLRSLPVASPAGAAARALETLLVWQERATFRRRLAALTSRELADMGLDRGAVRAEAAKPFWRT